MARFFLGLLESGDIHIMARIEGANLPVSGTFRGTLPKGRSFLDLPYEELAKLAEGPGFVETNDDGTVKE